MPFECTMKPQHGAKGRPSVPKAAGAVAAPSLQEELVAAIHGAFEVAVEIAVQEVTKLVGLATGDVHEEMRRENESLKQRLQRAEALLESARREGGGGCSPPPKNLEAADQRGRPPHPPCSQSSTNRYNVHGRRGVRVGASPAGHSWADHVRGDVETQPVRDAASQQEKDKGCDVAGDALTIGRPMIQSLQSVTLAQMVPTEAA